MRAFHIRRKLARRRARKAFEEAALTIQMQRVDGSNTGAQAAAQIVQSGTFGSWAHRQDIGDSAEYARELRRQKEDKRK